MWDVTHMQAERVFLLRFLLTHPVWDVTMWKQCPCRPNKISTHTSRVGCDYEYNDLYDNIMISTHTSRVGCDKHTTGNFCE